MLGGRRESVWGRKRGVLGGVGDVCGVCKFPSVSSYM